MQMLQVSFVTGRTYWRPTARVVDDDDVDDSRATATISRSVKRTHGATNNKYCSRSAAPQSIDAFDVFRSHLSGGFLIFIHVVVARAGEISRPSLHLPHLADV